MKRGIVKRGILATLLTFVLLFVGSLLRADDPAKANPEKPAAEEKKAEPPAAEQPKAAPKPDPSGAATGDRSVIGDDPKLTKYKLDEKNPNEQQDAHNKLTAYVETVADFSGKNRVALNMMWALLAGFLVMFMQAGFALVETGLTRAKNVAHTMGMNLIVYAVGVLGFWCCGYAFMMGGYKAFGNMGGAELLASEFTVTLFGKNFGLIGYDGFFLQGHAFDSGMLVLFLFMMVFMGTAATIPTGALAERWKFLAFVVFSAAISTVIYPIYGNWVWGNGWLAQLGVNFGLGHGFVDFAGSSVVHMTGGVASLAGLLLIGPRIGKYNKDGTVNALPAHNVPMYVLGTFILAFGWFGFNPGSTLAGADLNIARVAVNTMLASAAGASSCMVYMWTVYKKPDPSFMCNGMLAGLVAITAPCAFVAPWAAVLIGAVAGVLVVWSCLFIERTCKIDDPVGAISVHGVNGVWGILAVGLFADGTYSSGLNNSFWYKMADGSLKWFDTKLATLPDGAVEQGVTGLLYGNPSQLVAQFIGMFTNLIWVFSTSFLAFWIIGKVIGNRVSREAELQGLDISEMGVVGYVNEDPKTPEGHVTHPGAEPRTASLPPKGQTRFHVVIEGLAEAALKQAWSELCLPTQHPALEMLRVYPYTTTLSGRTFCCRGGDPEEIRSNLEHLLRKQSKGTAVRARIGA